jgi:hypothetical protein
MWAIVDAVSNLIIYHRAVGLSTNDGLERICKGVAVA